LFGDAAEVDHATSMMTQRQEGQYTQSPEIHWGLSILSLL